MTLEQLSNDYQALQDQIRVLGEKKKQILEDALQFAKVPVGTKIKHMHGHSKECIIVGIVANANSFGTDKIYFSYVYAPIKKDGTAGVPSSYRLSEESVINKAINLKL